MAEHKWVSTQAEFHVGIYAMVCTLTSYPIFYRKCIYRYSLLKWYMSCFTGPQICQCVNANAIQNFLLLLVLFLSTTICELCAVKGMQIWVFGDLYLPKMAFAQ